MLFILFFFAHLCATYKSQPHPPPEKTTTSDCQGIGKKEIRKIDQQKRKLLQVRQKNFKTEKDKFKRNNKITQLIHRCSYTNFLLLEKVSITIFHFRWRIE